MKYFVISDIHGFYDVLRESLQKAGYNSNNPDHHLIVVGDMFDRGNQSDLVLEYLYPLHQQGSATIIIGNHDTFLLDFLSGDRDNAEFNIRYNGFGKTLTSLASIQPPYKNLSELAKSIQKRYPFLQKWLASLPYYYELEDYIFVHGGIDGGTVSYTHLTLPTTPYV
jgi:serine/threonine protein phosphatase 1